MSTMQYYHIINYVAFAWRWFISKVLSIIGRAETDLVVQRFLSESHDLLRRFSSLKLAHFSLAIFLIILAVLGFFWALWRLRVSRYNQFWGLKKSVHFWTSFQTSAQPHYCSACRQLICGFWIFRNTGWECTVCGRTAHMRCVGACDKFDCKCPSQPEPLRHQLVQGNLPSDSVCGVCGIICASPFGLHGLRCLWCGRTVHEECFRHLPEICDLGPFESLVLPPSLVRLSLASSKLSRSSQSFSSLFPSKKSNLQTSGEAETSGASGSAQRYMRQMGAQLKEGLSQVHVAMAAGLFEGLKEVTADVRRINQLVRQEFRRRMKHELHQQHIEGRIIQLGPQDLRTVPSPTDSLTAATIEHTPLNDSNGIPIWKDDQTSQEHPLSIEPLTMALAPESLHSNAEDIQTSEEEIHLLKRLRSSSSPVLSTAIANLGTRHRSISHDSLNRSNRHLLRSTHSELGPRWRKCRSVKSEKIKNDKGLLSSTTDETPDNIDELDLISLSNGKLITLKKDSSIKTVKSEISIKGPTDSSILRISDSSPWVIQQTTVQRDARMRYRHERLRRLEQKRLTAVAGAFVARENRYGDRLFELAKLMPAKADVWEIDVGEGSASLISTGKLTTTNDTRKRQQRTTKNGNGHMPLERCVSQRIEIAIPSSLIERKPLLVFVNVKSGGQSGSQLLKEFYKLLNPIQVVDIQSDGGPQRALTLFKSLADLDRLRVLVCGGDGTAGWVMEEIRRLYGPPSQCHVPLGILPLGTGNDLSRVLGWGDSFDGDIQRCLMRMKSAQTRLLDQWNIQIHNHENREILNTCFNNYMDVGVAAKISLKFHKLREAHPELFQSRLGNKFLYGEMGVREWVTEKTIDLSRVRLWCDGLPVILPERKVEGLIVVNIPSFSGGVSLWSNEDIDQSSVDFRRYRYDSSIYHHPLELHRISHHITDTNNNQSEKRSRHSNRRRWNDEGLNLWPSSRRTGPPLLSSHERYHPCQLESRPPLPPRSKPATVIAAQSHSPRCRDHCEDTNGQSTLRWKRRSRLHGQVFHDTNSCPLVHSPNTPPSNTVPVDIPSLPSALRHSRSTRHYKCTTTSLESPFVTPMESRQASCMEGTSQSSSDNDFNSSSIKKSPTTLQRENCRSVADFRSSRQRPSNDEWSITQTASGAPNSVTGEATSDEGLHCIGDHSTQRNYPPLSTGASVRITHSATGDPSTFYSVGTQPCSSRASPMIGGIFRRWQKQSMRDELIEVVAVRSLFHLGQIQVGLAEPLRVCQGREIRIEIPVEVPCQIDGEPRVLSPQTTIDISYKGKSFVLSPVKSHDDALLLTVTEVMDAAVRDSILTSFQRNCLMWELEARMK